MKINKILISPQEYKESLTGIEVAKAMKQGILEVNKNIEIELAPVADGGDGTLRTMVDVTNGKIISKEVENPIGNIINSEWGKLGDNKTAVIEMAKASGLALLKDDQKSAINTSTFGTGQLFKDALDSGIKNFIVGIGGSATNDGGAGFISALGAKLLDDNNSEVKPSGANLNKISKIDLSDFDKRIKDITVNVACDVNNPMCGENGASAIFGPQKGASKSDIKMLDSNLLYWSEIIKAQFSKDILNVPGSGAAGGLGGGLMAFVNAQLSSGADIILNSLNYDNKLKGVDLVIVGEGQTDKSTQFNKSPVAVAERAKKLGIPVVCISGSLGDGYLESSVKGIDAFFSIVNKPMSLDIALNNAYDLISKSTKEIYKTLIF
ncbi:MAG: glycerate kinase [Dehalococcoidales bacterium]|nr:glycerate kinase [Dehalococcoidales bacterium]